jgi:hypothetical protein
MEYIMDIMLEMKPILNYDIIISGEIIMDLKIIEQLLMQTLIMRYKK